MKTEKFLELVVQIKEPELFFGVARILGVKLVDQNKVGADGHAVPRPFEEILDQIIVNYALAPRKRKRELDQILKDAISEQGKPIQH